MSDHPMSPPTQTLLQAADLRGATRLTTDAVIALADLVEAMHAGIASTPGMRAFGVASGDDQRTRGLTGLVYRTVRGVARLAGGSVDVLLGALSPLLPTPDPGLPVRPEREAFVSALNGVLGDTLVATGNPLAITMGFRCQGRALLLEHSELRSQLERVTPRLLVLVHGLCMNDLQWQRAGHHHGDALARDLGYTPVHVVYNSGLGVPTNGRLLSQMMERLVRAWPVPVERLALIGHSMGGLVARSALHHGTAPGRESMAWPSRVDSLVCLGTPHLGAPLERAGHGIDLVLEALPYAAPLARIGKARSAGINDLRHGHVADLPSEGRRTSRSAMVPLPDRTRCFAVAASLGPETGRIKARLLGDGLVPVASALGEHRDPARRLAFPADHRAVVHDTGHLDLLSSSAVYAALHGWLR
jgi:pimeloyl-ACP methyl ester carboxylesterase